MSVSICAIHRFVLNVAVQIQRLWVAELGVGNSGGGGGPVGDGEASEEGRVVAGAELVEAGFAVAFFAGEFVVVADAAVAEHALAAKGIVIGLFFAGDEAGVAGAGAHGSQGAGGQV